MGKALGIACICTIVSNCIVAVVLLKADDGSTSNLMPRLNESMDGAIFGVRWRLGDAYALQQTYQNNEQYLLNFNSHRSLNVQTYVKFKDSSFACSEQRHSLQNFTTFIHTCRINQKLPPPYEYQIVSREVQIAGGDNNAHIASVNQTVRYSGRLRLDNIGQSTLILGDVQFGLNGTVLCGLPSVLERNNISMVVIGNVHPINQDNYEQILRMLEPITSQTMTMSVKELNASQNGLASILFPLPQSALEKSYSIISINPFNLTIITLHSNLNASPIMSSLSEQEKERVEGSLILQISSVPSIADSVLYQPIRADVQIYTQNAHSFSKRTLCGDYVPSQMEDSSKRRMCPLIIVEGSIDMASQMLDYGVLLFQVTPSYNTLSFDHFSRCLPSDHIEFNYNQTSQQVPPQPDDKTKSQIRHIILAAEYIAIVSLTLFILITYLIHRKKASGIKKEEEKHVELVQEIVGGSLPAQK